jgi:hypothetical protein
MRTGGVLAVSLTLGQKSYPEPARRLAFFEEVEARLGRIPGVTEAAVSDTLPKDRPWNEPIIAMMFCRPVAYRASLIAPSTASVPEFVRKLAHPPNGASVELLADVGDPGR